MPQMQDKEFDQLFRNKFEDAEVQPSAHLWSNIEAEINKPKKKFSVYWIAAALAVAALSIGLLTKQPAVEMKNGSTIAERKKSVQQTDHQDILSPDITTSPAIAVKSIATSAEAAHQGSKKTLSSSSPQNLPLINRRHTTLEEKGVIASVSGKKDLTAMQPFTLITHHDNSGVVVTQHKSELPVIRKKTEAVMMANADVQTARNDVINNNDADTENKGIRNMGDLINFVVDKVDKREDKLIQFKTEDDNSSLVALNIGVFKFNQRKQK